MIEPITPEHLQPDVLESRVIPDLRRCHYWTRDWAPDFYVALAREGFISIASEHDELGALLLPELQYSYAVLDWSQLHQSRHVRKLRRSGRLESEAIELRVSRDPDAVIRALALHHGSDCWLIEPYRRLMSDLADPRGNRDGGFSLCATELWSRRTGELIAGEIGYVIGRVYTSLSGFSSPDDPTWRDFGTLQLVLLAERLRDTGHAFWNLGHPYMAYKIALGARVIRRKAFLRRWHRHRDEVPESELWGVTAAAGSIIDAPGVASDAPSR